MGKIRYWNGDEYCGEINGLGRNGRGVYVNSNGETFKGIFKNGILISSQWPINYFYFDSVFIYYQLLFWNLNQCSHRLPDAEITNTHPLILHLFLSSKEKLDNWLKNKNRKSSRHSPYLILIKLIRSAIMNLK